MPLLRWPVEQRVLMGGEEEMEGALDGSDGDGDDVRLSIKACIEVQR